MNKVIIYTTKNCPYSKRLKDFLYEEGIPFEEIKADQNKENAEKLQKADPQLRTPVIEIITNVEKQKLIGWNDKTKTILNGILNFK